MTAITKTALNAQSNRASARYGRKKAAPEGESGAARIRTVKGRIGGLGDKPVGLNPTMLNMASDWVGRLGKVWRFGDVI